MDPISVIVQALISGVANGLQPTAERAVRDSYDALKEYLVGKYSSTKSEISRLEHSPEDDTISAVLYRSLSRLKVDQDKQALALAVQMLRAERGLPSASQVIEMAKTRAALKAIRQRLDEQIAAVSVLRSGMDWGDRPLASRLILSDSRIDKATRRNAGGLHSAMRAVILEVAQNIENAKYRNVENDLEQIRFSGQQRDKARRLVRADQDIHISLQSLRLTIDYFTELNESIIQKADDAATVGDVTREIDYLIGNALLAYELTDFVIEFVENFRILGIPEARKIHTAIKTEIDGILDDDRKLEVAVQDEDIGESVRGQVLEDIRTRREAIRIVEDEWISYLNDLNELDGLVGRLPTQIKELIIVRKNALQQLRALETVFVLQALKESLRQVQLSTAAITSMKLAPLSPDRVRRLLRIADDKVAVA